MYHLVLQKKKNQKLTEGILSYAHLTQSKPFKETKAAQSLNLKRAKIICFLLLSRGRELFSLNFPERASLLRINDLIHPEYCGNLCLKDMVTILLKAIILKLPPSRFVCPSSKLNMVIWCCDENTLEDVPALGVGRVDQMIFKASF